MAKQSNQKAKLLYLQKFLTEETDAQHGITIAGLVDRLAEAGIAAERKSLYDDIEVLRAFGLQIETVRGRANSYKLTGRVLQAQEVVKTGLALKAAGVEGAEAIIESLCGLLSKYDAESVKNELAAAVMPQQDNAHSTEAQEAPAEILPEAAPEAEQSECVKEAAQPENDKAEEKSAPQAEKTAAAKDASAARKQEEINKQLGVVVEATKDVRTLEKLEEKQLEDYKAAANKENEQFIEEFVSGQSIRAAQTQSV